MHPNMHPAKDGRLSRNTEMSSTAATPTTTPTTTLPGAALPPPVSVAAMEQALTTTEANLTFFEAWDLCEALLLAALRDHLRAKLHKAFDDCRTSVGCGVLTELAIERAVLTAADLLVLRARIFMCRIRDEIEATIAARFGGGAAPASKGFEELVPPAELEAVAAELEPLLRDSLQEALGPSATLVPVSECAAVLVAKLREVVKALHSDLSSTLYDTADTADDEEGWADKFKAEFGDFLAWVRGIGDEVAEGVGDAVGGAAGGAAESALRKGLGYLNWVVVLSVLGLMAKQDRNPVAYNAKRGQQLKQENKALLYLCKPLDLLHRRRIAGTVFVVLVFLLALWTFPIASLVIPDLLIPSSKSKEYSDDFVQWQVDDWYKDDEHVDHLCLFAAKLFLPFALVVLIQCQINYSDLAMCGSLMRKLEIHHFCLAEGKVRKQLGTFDALSLTQTFEAVQATGGAAPVRELQADLRLRACVNFSLMLLLLACAIAGQVTHTVLERFGDWEWARLYYFVPQMFFQLAVYCAGIVAAFAGTTQFLSQVRLLTANIDAYRQLVGNVAVSASLALRREEAADPALVGAQARLRNRKAYLVACADELIRGDLGRSVAALYTFVACAFVFFAVYSFLQFLKIYANDDPSSERVNLAILYVVAIALAQLCLLQPLRAMAEMTVAWKKVVEVTSSEAMRRALMTTPHTKELVPKKSSRRLLDYESLAKEHTDLTRTFTWSILGIDVTYSTITSLMMKGVSLLWSSVLLPAVIDQILQIQDKYLTYSLSTTTIATRTSSDLN